ncbi:MAG: cobyric acid synthase [Haloferacaceae archaeon]
MARTILVAGTASHVGKSTVAAGLCRRLADCGVSVAPYKAQNMSNNARAVPRATGEGFGEVGVSQYVQARAARVRPTTDHNPVLLKPRGEGESQLVIDGEAVAHVAAGEYYDRHWERAREAAERAHARLASEHDVVVAEGAGSVAEINLHDRDLANVETARFADGDVVLVADIERGGAFAALVGSLDLMPDDVRERVVGAVITKFRGDRSLLDTGIEAFEARTGVPVLDVLPHDDPGLPEEDSVALPAAGERAVRGTDDVPPERRVTVAVPRLPRTSNATDLGPLAAVPGVRVAWVPLDAPLGADTATGRGMPAADGGGDRTGADAVVLPGSKNAVDDLLAARTAGLGERLRGFDGPVLGLCAGYQLLGERVTGAASEGTGDRDVVPGLGLLPVETRFSPDKRVAATTFDCAGTGPLAGVDGALDGYEIHAGETRALDGADADLVYPFSAPDGREGAALGAARGAVLGTYLHGLFENPAAREAFVDACYRAAGRERPAPGADAPAGRSPHDRAAALAGDVAAALGFDGEGPGGAA